MAGFHTHIAVSTAVGIGYGVWGGTQYDLTPTTCAFAAGLCSIAGIMPDLYSDSGVPARETLGFVAAIVPMLVFNKLQAYGMTVEQMFLAGVPIYLLVRFGLGSIFKSVSVHRGMFHSIPAAIIAGLIGYLICDTGVHLVRNYKAFAVVLGYLTHLFLDELWSIDLHSGAPRLKKSFGTALKFFGDNPGPTVMTYSLLALLTLFAANDYSLPPKPSTFARRPDAMTPAQRAFASPAPNTGTSALSPTEQVAPSNDGWERPRAARRTRMDDPWR